MLRIRVSTASAEIAETELITAGRVGLQCAFEFNDAWDGLAKTVVIHGGVKRYIVLVGNTILVPGECLARENFPLRIGVYGQDGSGNIVIPTIWVNFGKIRPSAGPIVIPEITPNVAAQIQYNSSEALRIAQEIQEKADNGEFNGRDGATGPRGEDGTDGQNGNSIWTTTETPMPASGGVAFTQLTGRSGIPPVVGDVIVRSSRYVYQVVEVTVGGTVVASLMGDIKGEQGVADTIWRTTAYIGAMYPSGYVVNVSDLVGRSGATPKKGDLVIGPESGQTGDPTYLYTISRISGSASIAGLDGIGSIKGATGATGPQGPGVTEDLRAALLQLAQKVAYIDKHGADYYQDLYDALYPSANLLSITAIFTQGSTVVYDDADLDDLRPMLYVVGHYDDNTDAEVTNYDLSGNLTAGSSVVTVSYQSKTTTFTVNVTARPTLSSISAVYTQSGTVYDTDTLDSLKADLVVTAHYSDSSTQTVPAADYTLSGALTAGTSTITVSYGGKTTTFSVTVSEELIPSDYQQVEYLEATQTSTSSGGYFNTGVNSPEHTELKYVVGFMPSGVIPSANIKQNIIGTRKTETGSKNDVGFSIDVRSDNAAIGAFSGISVYFEESTINQRFDLTATWTATGLTINNGSSTESVEGETRGCVGYPICVFGLKKAANTQYTNTFNGRIYYAKAYANGELIVDMVPCYRKSDSVIGMYNKATGSFNTPSGSAAVFTAGPDVT